MCTSLILKPIFIIVLAIGTALTAVSLFTPGWRSFTGDHHVSEGLLTKSCGSNSTDFDFSACKDFFNSRPGWEKAVIALMFVALILEVVVLVWSVFSCFCFCFPSCFTLATFVTAIATICLVVAVALYGGKNSNSIGSVPNSTKMFSSESNVAYSFWLGVAAAGTVALATLIGSVASLLSSFTPL